MQAGRGSREATESNRQSNVSSRPAIEGGRQVIGGSRPAPRTGLQVMMGLIGMIRPLLGIMLGAVLLGCIGNLMATFLTVLGGYGFLTVAGLYDGMKLSVIFGALIIFAVLRGILRYGEQASNHYIAFKLLARIRHQVFAALRRLAPAKLDGSEKGNLISIITSDIELLEVFYAHTISPVAIAVLTSLFMVIFLGRIHPLFGLVGLFFYLLVGAVIPVINGKIGGEKGQEYRNAFGSLNTCVLDNLYGLEEILQYHQEAERLEKLGGYTEQLGSITRNLKKDENSQRVITDGVILLAGVVMAAAGGWLSGMGKVSSGEAVIAVIAMMSSFGPTAALSALSNNLHHTLAAGNRVLDILEEEPVVEDIVEGVDRCEGDIVCRKVNFSYVGMDAGAVEKSSDGEDGCGPDVGIRKGGVLRDFDQAFAVGKIHGILGKSGCGKSTLLKLLMRFYQPEEGQIAYGEDNLERINTRELRSGVAYVTQETFLFQDTIENNIKVAKEDATREEVIAAAKKAAIHDFIMSTPQGYDTRLAELGDSVSGGEKQRIGIARAFLHNSRILFLDEPTSNIDSLNEGMILRSLEQEREDKTIILVSHRKSTMGIAQEVHSM